MNILKILHRWRPPLPLGKTPFISSVVDDSLFIYMIFSHRIGSCRETRWGVEWNAHSRRIPYIAEYMVWSIISAVMYDKNTHGQVHIDRNIMHDEHHYENPNDFNPDRFLRDESSGTILDPGNAVFGFGRR